MITHIPQEQDGPVTIQHLSTAPKTVLSPSYLSVTNLAPQDAPHPLYHDAPENEALRDEFLLDYLVQEPVTPIDIRRAQPGSLTATNLAGHKLTFAVHDAGEQSIKLI